MSLDLFLIEHECELCHHIILKENFNYTYNVSKMWNLIYPNEKMVEIEGMNGKEAFKKLSHARYILEKNPKEFELLNPENGWGSYEGFLEFINKLIWQSLRYLELKWGADR